MLSTYERVKRGCVEHSKILVWDTFAIDKANITYLMDEEGLSKDEAEKQTYNSSSLHLVEWEDRMDFLTELLPIFNYEEKEWLCRVSGFGWRGLNGYNKFSADNGQDFLCAILPNTDCTFNIFVEALSWSYVYKCTEEEYEAVRIVKRAWKEDDNIYYIWSNRKYVTKEDAEEAMKVVAPNRGALSLPAEIEIRIQNYHHDSPCGNEWYYIRPVASCIGCGEDVSYVDNYSDFAITEGTREVFCLSSRFCKEYVCSDCACEDKWDFVEPLDKYAIRVNDKDEAVDLLFRADANVDVDNEGNPSTLWVTTALTEAEIQKVLGDVFVDCVKAGEEVQDGVPCTLGN